jgi:hypothetical protein
VQQEASLIRGRCVALWFTLPKISQAFPNREGFFFAPIQSVKFIGSAQKTHNDQRGAGAPSDSPQGVNIIKNQKDQKK